VCVAALDDLQGPATCVGDNFRHLWSLIVGIGEDPFNEGEQAPRRTEQVAGAVTILHIGGLNADAQQEAERVDQDTHIEAEGKSAGGIIIPDTAKEKPSEGEVIAVGPGGRDEAGKLIPIDLKTGDRVLFGKWSGTEVKIDGVEYLIMKESDIMGVIEQTALQNAASIAGLLITTEAMVAERPKKDSGAPAMPGGGMGGMDY
jgi:chaperonin GroES